MAYSRTRSLAWSPPQVFETALVLAPRLGFAISQADREGGHLYLNRPRRLHRFPRRYSMSVTDSGLGTTVVNITWEPNGRLPAGAHGAARLHRRIHQALGSRQAR